MINDNDKNRHYKLVRSDIVERPKYFEYQTEALKYMSENGIPEVKVVAPSSTRVYTEVEVGKNKDYLNLMQDIEEVLPMESVETYMDIIRFLAEVENRDSLLSLTVRAKGVMH